MGKKEIVQPVHVALYGDDRAGDTPGPGREENSLRRFGEFAAHLFSTTGVALFSFQDARLEQAVRSGEGGPWTAAVIDFLDRWDRRRARLWLPDQGYPLPDEVTKAARRFRERPIAGERAALLYLGYSGKEEILRATRRLAEIRREAKSGMEAFEAGLVTAGLPDPDLLILTGEYPVMPDFLLYQISYSELYLAGRTWDRFTLRDLEAACQSFQGRERRYGRVTPP